MFESGKKGDAAKKAYEIAYALFRMSAKISEGSIRGKLESYSIDLLTSVNAEEYSEAARALSAIDCLVKIAVDLNIINISNGDVLFREIGFMNETIIECMDKSDDIDASKFFSSPREGGRKVFPPVMPGPARNLDTVIPANTRSSASTSPARNLDAVTPMSPPVILRENAGPSFSRPAAAPSTQPPAASSFARNPVGQTGLRGESVDALRYVQDDRVNGNTKLGNPAGSLRSGNRQIAILDRIRQSGNCKLKEIQDILPDCSERTIRYDLEELIERNLVERIGSGGPAVSYRVRQIA